ncbi:MAG: metal ABC transporter ATP-binding protein [Elusimicrobiota bacterium]|nr:metal ABC transporter ATP-binding protein [Elusimicrobiota bacterium]
MALISCQNISCGYLGKAALKNLSFDIMPQDYLCISGQNGCGKSALIKTLLGLIKPIGGRIFMDKNLHQQDIGYMPQTNSIQKDFPASVFEAVSCGILNKTGFLPFYSKKQSLKILQNLDNFGILGIKDKSYQELSGGQRQRVLLARAFCAAEKLLILDEPSNNLDPAAVKNLYERIREKNEAGTAIAVVSHDLDIAGRYAKNFLKL